MISKLRTRFDNHQTLTCGGETSEINTKGTGPSPIANELVPHIIERVVKQETEKTNVTKVITAMLEMITVPVSKPTPMAICDAKAPTTDASSNRFRPVRWADKKYVSPDTLNC